MQLTLSVQELRVRGFNNKVENFQLRISNIISNS